MIGGGSISVVDARRMASYGASRAACDAINLNGIDSADRPSTRDRTPDPKDRSRNSGALLESFSDG